MVMLVFIIVQTEGKGLFSEEKLWIQYNAEGMKPQRVWLRGE